MSRTISPAMPVAELATRNPICIDRDTTILGACSLMRIYRVDELVVTDQRNDLLVPIGMVSAQDIVTRIIATGLDPSVLTAGDIVWSGSTRAKSIKK